tara:strand:+ start:2643 stop:3932 length:1290 start_codon:yes stop_codon:yes gene_type:complete
MPTSRHLKFLRFLEYTLLLIFILVAISVVLLSEISVIGRTEVWAGVGVLFITSFTLILVQRRVDNWMSVVFSQMYYSNNDAFSALYDSSPVAYVTIEETGRIVGFNPAAVNLLKAETDSFKQNNFYRLIAEGETINASVVQGKIGAGVTINDEEVPMKTVTGDEVWVSLSVYTSRNKNERMIAMVDVTEKKMIDTAKSEFVALATHQLRTPIAAIRWNVELLNKNLGGAKSEKQNKYIGKIDRNVHKMIHLINDFLSVSKLEMGTYAAETETVNLSEYMTSILDEFDEKIISKLITLKRTDNPPNINITTDRRLFHIIVSNLVSNAVKYLNANGELIVSYSVSDGVMNLIVADNGIGIPESELGNLFTKFYRASNAQSHQTEGTGLGLYIVKQSVENLGGTISVTSAENEGARFEVVMPVKVVSEVQVG